MRLLAVLLALSLMSADARAACPNWRERQTIDCMRGYLRVAPAGLTVALDRDEYAYYHRPANRFGYLVDVSGGMFRAYNRVALAVGARFAYGTRAITLVEFGDHRYHEYHLHVGPEVRVGVTGDRWFAYGLLRAGYSRWSNNTSFRTSYSPSAANGGHWGLGYGVWGRLGRRFLLGGEAAFDLLHLSDRDVLPTVTLSLSLGAWL